METIPLSLYKLYILCANRQCKIKMDTSSSMYIADAPYSMLKYELNNTELIVGMNAIPRQERENQPDLPNI